MTTAVRTQERVSSALVGIGERMGLLRDSYSGTRRRQGAELAERTGAPGRPCPGLAGGCRRRQALPDLRHSDRPLRQLVQTLLSPPGRGQLPLQKGHVSAEAESTPTMPSTASGPETQRRSLYWSSWAGLFGSAFLYMKVLVDEIAPIEITRRAPYPRRACRICQSSLSVARPFGLDPATVGKISRCWPWSIASFRSRSSPGPKRRLRAASPRCSCPPCRCSRYLIAFAGVARRKAGTRSLARHPVWGFLGVLTLSGGDVLDLSGVKTLPDNWL